MKYSVEIGDRTIEVEVENGRVLIDGRDIEARLSGKPGDVSRLLVRGAESRPFLAARGETRGSWTLSADGALIGATVLDFRAQVMRKAGAAGAARAHSGVVKAPMPGLVVRVLVEEGARVEAGQGLVVVEAMKMENELRAAGAGTVSRVLVAVGARVEKGTVLVEVDPTRTAAPAPD